MMPFLQFTVWVGFVTLSLDALAQVAQCRGRSRRLYRKVIVSITLIAGYIAFLRP